METFIYNFFYFIPSPHILMPKFVQHFEAVTSLEVYIRSSFYFNYGRFLQTYSTIENNKPVPARVNKRRIVNFIEMYDYRARYIKCNDNLHQPSWEL